MANRYAVYQLKDEQPCRGLRGRTYEQLTGDSGSVDPAHYLQVYMAGMKKDDNVRRILKRLTKELPDGFAGHPIEVADVIALIVNECPTAWYVNDLGGGLILTPGFFRAQSDEGTRLIILDQEEYTLKEKEGRWVPVEEFIISGIPFYVMRNGDDLHSMRILVTFDGIVIAEGFREPDRQEWELARLLLEQRKAYYENGEFHQIPYDRKKQENGMKTSLEEQVKQARKAEDDRKEKEKAEEEDMLKKKQEKTSRIQAEKKKNAQAEKVFDQIHAAADDQDTSSQKHGFSGSDIMAYMQGIARRLDALEEQTGAKQKLREND